MKTKTTLTLLLLTIFTGATAQDYYWSADKKIPLVKDINTILMRVVGGSSTEGQLTQSNFVASLDRINSEAILVRLKSSEQTDYVKLSNISENWTFSFKTETGHKMEPTGEILFEPKKGVDFDKINSLVDGKLRVVKEKYGAYRVFIDNYKDLVSTANKIYESGLVKYSHPNFIVDIQKHQNDPIYLEQYYLNNTGQFGGTAGIDINAPEAWAITKSLRTIRVAVIDDGVENHIDIDGRVLQGFTPTDPNGFGAPIAGAEGHGQACAGIIAASRNNNEGIAGIAPCTNIIPINIFTFNETIADYAAAIDWAWNDGQADVLSNSWGYIAPNIYHDNIAQAIYRARTEGRENSGAVVIFASGNSNLDFNGVTFPANVTGVITVGAIDNNGYIHDYSSRGPEMDLVAPSGGNPGNVRTTDLMGTRGYDAGNYTNTFTGTSAAAPQVSGVAALVLSVNPNLTEQQVFSILTSTATDMGSSGIDNTFGHGRLNAEAAVRQALPIISGMVTLCSSATYSVNSFGDSIINWSLSNTSAASLSSSTGSSVTITATAGYRTNVILTANISSNECDGNVTLTKSIWIGKPGVPSYLFGPTEVLTGAIVNYQGGISEGATFYEWRLPYPFTTVSIFNYSSPDWQLEAPGNTRYAKAFTGYAKTNGYVQVMGVNACGTGGAKIMYVSHGTGGGGSIASIDENSDGVDEVAVSPNPASNRVTVRLSKLTEYEGDPPTRILGIKVLDQNSRERKFYQYNEHLREVEINVAFLTRGLNFLIIITDQGSFTKKLLIE